MFGGILLSVCFLMISSASTSKFIIPTVPDLLHPSHAEFFSSASGLDAPKVTPINTTSFDWWYFDAISLDSNASIVVTFFTATEGGFAPLIGQIEVDSVIVSASFPDGTLSSVTIPATKAVIEVKGEGSSGVWGGTGVSWEGTADLSRYIVTLDAPVLGIEGTIVLESVSLDNVKKWSYPRTRLLQRIIHVDLWGKVKTWRSALIGWSNAIPDAIAAVNVSFGTNRLQFVGSGYHDKNWGDQPFIQNVGSWSWGHGRLGPYSIVWFELLHPNGTQYLSAYAAQNGSIVSSQCSGVKVQPTGTNSLSLLFGNSEGFHIDLELGDQGVLGVNVSNIFVTLEAADIYMRSIGSLEGGLNGANNWIGVSTQDEFHFSE